MELEANDLARLRSQVSRGEVVLFTGAGFSSDAKDHSGRAIPSSTDLKRELWELCYPGEAFDTSSSLGDLYGAALIRRRSDLTNLLQSRLTVHSDSLPEFYNTYLNFPWYRYYTLNVDDLESAVARRFSLVRPVVSISTTIPHVELPSPRGLEAVHLNGAVPGPPESLTFSESQYAERIANQEPWYARCVVDVTSRPVIFIGTVLSESLLWQHMHLRRRRENVGRDLRPTSILVTKELPLPRRDILRDLRIYWLAGTAEEFAAEILPLLREEAKRGFVFIHRHIEGYPSEYIPLVSEAAAERPNVQTEYLLGDEPQWSDILAGRAVERSHDRSLLDIAEEILTNTRKSTALAITGTAGSGQSTALMSLVLKLSGNGVPVLWIDKNSEVTTLKMKNRVRESRERIVLAIDDADLYGRELVGLLRDLVPDSKEFLFVFAARSSKLDEICSVIAATRELQIYEHVVPPLSDSDIDGLIEVLEKNNRLGILTGASAADRRKAFRDQAGRQLLVAMIQATSGENFERKAHDEYAKLEPSQKYPYALICVATSLRHALTRDEILLAQGDARDEALAAVERLVARHLVVPIPSRYEYRCRHRVIADLVFNKLIELRELNDVLLGLAWALASKTDPSGNRKSRTHQFFVRVINHDFLLNTVGVIDARILYHRLETIQSWDYHYWLQRGSLEVETGDVRLAENFLGAARSLGSGDFRVETAYAYMLVRKAYEAPNDLNAQEFLNTGISSLEDIIDHWGRISEYPYHVLGSQGLAWIRRCGRSVDEKRTLISRLLDAVEDGVKIHQTENLKSLRDALKRELMLTAVTRTVQ